MKHAGAAALDRLEPLLAAVRRARPGLTERARGVFHERSSAFLHFHEDPAGLFADVKVSGTWRRIDVTGSRGRGRLLDLVRAPSAARPAPTRSGPRTPAAGARTPRSSGRPGPR